MPDISQPGNSSTPQLWLIGGTGEAVTLAKALVPLGVPCLVTVTTAAAKRAYPEHPGLAVRAGALALEHLADFIQTHHIGAILDASHPFAVEISQGAIAQAAALNLPYWRYERPLGGEADVGACDPALCKEKESRLSQSSKASKPLDPPSLDEPTPAWRPLRVPNVEAALTSDILAGQRVLFTLGYRWLAACLPWQDRATLFARILPSPVALEAALAAGFTSERLIALRPPIGEALEQALWQQWGITTVITKASGQPGGEDTKRRVAERLGVSLVVIERPRLAYPAVGHSLEEMVAWCGQWWQGQKRRATL